MDRWEEFFDMMDDITNTEGTVEQKIEEIRENAKRYDSDSALEEFLGYFGRKK